MNPSMLNAHQQRQTDVWYREPWLLLVMGGPALVVCASLFTAYLAVNGADKVVTTDYYRQGLLINKDLQRDEFARTHHLRAQVRWEAAQRRFHVQLSADVVLPDSIQLSLANADEAGSHVREIMHRLTLHADAPGSYSAQYDEVAKPVQAPRLFHVKLEDTRWRLTGDWFAPQQKQLELVAR